MRETTLITEIELMEAVVETSAGPHQLSVIGWLRCQKPVE